MATPPTPAHANTVGWYILEGYPWWPVYICDQFKLRPQLYSLGDGHKKILKRAKDFPKDYALVYYFGSPSFSLAKLNKGVLKPWDCEEKDQFIKGHPKHLMKKGTNTEDLKVAVQDVEDYLSQPEDMRLPPHMVPSDLDPTLEPPPPMEHPEAEEEEGEEEMEDDADGGDEDDGDADEDMEADEDEKKKKTKQPVAKKKDKAADKKTKKEKKEKEKKPPKEKKEKKPPAAKKEKAEPKKKPESAKLKRQRSSGGDGDDAEGEDASKPKKGKMEKSGDVKSAKQSDGEDLAEVLEREIRWILSNEQYEEMTTKMLRKVLEERLKRDLKQHRETIKAVVTRVIEEEEDAVAATGDVKDAVESEKTEDGDVPMKEEAESDKSLKQEPEPEGTSSNGISSEVKEELVASEEPAASEEPVNGEEKSEVDENKAVKVETEPTPQASPPKPVDEADINAMKDKLVDAETSHDELLSILNELQQMPLEMKHLKNTGIARVVANLRQHANDKVSIAAKNLRNAWMRLADKGKQSSNLKRLEKMNESLESEAESDETKLGVLHKLEKLTVTTQEIIDSKIGVTISKLRKASHTDIAQTANKLRQKWKKLAASE